MRPTPPVLTGSTMVKFYPQDCQAHYRCTIPEVLGLFSVQKKAPSGTFTEGSEVDPACLIYEHRKQDCLFVWFCISASHTQTILYQPITFTWLYTFSLEYNFPLSHCLWLSSPIHQQRWNQHFSSSNITVFPFHSIPQEISPKLLNHHHSLPSRLSFIKYQRLIVSLETELNTLRNW